MAGRNRQLNPQNVSRLGDKSLTTRDLMSHSQDYGVARLQLHESFNWRAALWASVVAAFVFATLYIGLGRARDEISPSLPTAHDGSYRAGPAPISPPDTFDAQIVVVAILLHIVLSIVYGTFLALVMPTGGTALGILLGGFYGLALYYINFYGFNAFSPWFVDQRDWLSIVRTACSALRLPTLTQRSRGVGRAARPKDRRSRCTKTCHAIEEALGPYAARH